MKPQLVNEKESLLLLRLDNIASQVDKLVLALEQSRQQQRLQETELISLRSEMSSIQQENQHLREVLQTWRQRLDQILRQLPDLDLE